MQKTRYEVHAAPMGWAVVMVTPEGDRRCVEVGIKRWDSATKKAARWQKREDKASRHRVDLSGALEE